jgi:hypothetical protein
MVRGTVPERGGGGKSNPLPKAEGRRLKAESEQKNGSVFFLIQPSAFSLQPFPGPTTIDRGRRRPARKIPETTKDR